MAAVRSILIIVPYEPADADLLSRELTSLGHKVQVTTVGSDLVREISRTEPSFDLVILHEMEEPQSQAVAGLTHQIDADLTVIEIGALDGQDDPVWLRDDAPSLSSRDPHSLVTCGLEHTALRRRNRFLEDRMANRAQRSTHKLRETQDTAIFGLAKLVESRDSDTGNHLERMAEYSRMLAVGLRDDPFYSEYITNEYIHDLFRSAPLHDIGKIGVPDHILLKPGKLTDEEWVVMRSHSVIGGDNLREIENRLHYRSFFRMGRDIAFCHHEKWNGTGYPFKLVGEEIPLCARIVALADVYDALTSRRPYKEPFSHDKAVSIIREGAGSHFDPNLVRVFDRIHPCFPDVAAQHSQESGNNGTGFFSNHDLIVGAYRRNGRRLQALRRILEGEGQEGDTRVSPIA